MRTLDEMRAGPSERIPGSGMTAEQDRDRQVAHWLAHEGWLQTAEICERLDRLITDERPLGVPDGETEHGDAVYLRREGR